MTIIEQPRSDLALLPSSARSAEHKELASGLRRRGRHWRQHRFTSSSTWLMIDHIVVPHVCGRGWSGEVLTGRVSTQWSHGPSTLVQFALDVRKTRRWQLTRAGFFLETGRRWKNPGENPRMAHSTCNTKKRVSSIELKTHGVENWRRFSKSKIGTNFWYVCHAITTAIVDFKNRSRQFSTPIRTCSISRSIFSEALDRQKQM